MKINGGSYLYGLETTFFSERSRGSFTFFYGILFEEYLRLQFGSIPSIVRLHFKANTPLKKSSRSQYA